jgi:hypothetical protein
MKQHPNFFLLDRSRVETENLKRRTKPIIRHINGNSIMSRHLIEEYYNSIEKIKQYSGSKKEMSLRSEFANLLNYYCKSKNLLLIPELDYSTKKGNTVNPDGTVKDALRLDLGYWESKDEYDDLDKEIAKKIEKGYPTSNILFEDSNTAVLIQQGREVNRVEFSNSAKLDALLQQFINYEREEIKDFHRAIEKFKEDLPLVLDALSDLIKKEGNENQLFRKSRDKLLTFPTSNKSQSYCSRYKRDADSAYFD